MMTVISFWKALILKLSNCAAHVKLLWPICIFKKFNWLFHILTDFPSVFFVTILNFDSYFGISDLLYQMAKPPTIRTKCVGSEI